jgi:Cu2+-exporting ATPase
VYFDSLTMFVSFLLGGRYARDARPPPSRQALEDSLAHRPRRRCASPPTGASRRRAARLRARRPRARALGEMFPADGVLLDGRTAGRRGAAHRRVGAGGQGRRGAALVAGSVNVGAPVHLRVERVGADTRYEAIVAMMRDALTQRPAAARTGRPLGRPPFLWAVLLLRAGGGGVERLIDPRGGRVAVAVLIVTCPCALSLAAPAALVAGRRPGAPRRAVQRLDALETLARVAHCSSTRPAR